MIDLKVWYTEEPELIFGNSLPNFDPKIGIYNNGPFYEKGSTLTPNQINIGIVGDADSIDFTKDWIEKMKKFIPNEKSNPNLFPYFKGADNLGIELINNKNWNKELSSRDIDRIIDEEFNMRRIGMAADMFIKELEVITEQIIKPDVVIIALPIKLDQYIAPATFHTRNIHKQAKYTKLETTLLEYETTGQKQIGDFLEGVDVLKVDKERYYNFRRVLKAKAMELENPIPTQIFRPKRFEKKKDIQIDSEIAWNLFIGLFYKAGGIPWKVNGLEKNTCYVGISFYKEKESENLRSSLAQIFSKTGEGLVLRGKQFEWEGWGYPHLGEETAVKLLSDAIGLYKKHWKIEPRRIVIHKSSYYDDNELKGFKKAIKDIPVYDFLSFSKTDIRFLRSSKNYPVLRGTTVRLPNNTCLLYIKGFNPYLKTYRGHGIPRPLYISHHMGDSSYKQLCNEIMALSRLNWNSADFCLNNPITTHFAGKIGQILSEYNPIKEVQRDYRYYM